MVRKEETHASWTYSWLPGFVLVWDAMTCIESSVDEHEVNVGEAAIGITREGRVRWHFGGGGGGDSFVIRKVAV